MLRITIWYVDTLGDSHTNEVVARLLQAEIPAVNCSSFVLCQDGHKRDLWEVKYATITKLKNSKSELNLRFTVFKREGKYGPVKKWDFPKRKLTGKKKEEAEWLDNLKKKQNKKG